MNKIQILDELLKKDFSTMDGIGEIIAPLEEETELINKSYRDYMTPDKSIEVYESEIDSGGLEFNTALLTLIYRQDHFCDGTGEYFNKYCRNGVVKKILTRIRELLNENN